MPMTLGYWDIRGLAHPIRLLLEYTDSSYEEKRYTMGDGAAHSSDFCEGAFWSSKTRLWEWRAGSSFLCDFAPDYDRSQWLSEKFKLSLDFPNLPYLIDGVQKITQSNAILRYIARKHNLCGETEEEKTRVDILENQALDTRMQLAMVCYSPDFEKRKPEYLETLPEKMKLYSQFLGKHPWFAGDKITFVDFIAYDVLDLHRLFEPKCLDAFPNLKDFMSRFEGLKKISAYMKSSRFLPTPMYSKMAAWGNK
ncbi:Hypothetical predicted protein [Marmota monax]|uniref:Glutathione S-transferase n=1 Tax=Marmota monax TaxID=9995 RepID=A0A5E4BIM0_MARMO|nr:glutathione S-transferase Mu 1 isoform X1 [Marmota marmota marmota]VTJ68759.1 Hypothetical predicted protein [Marmota monax]